MEKPHGKILSVLIISALLISLFAPIAMAKVEQLAEPAAKARIFLPIVNASVQSK